MAPELAGGMNTRKTMPRLNQAADLDVRSPRNEKLTAQFAERIYAGGTT